MNTGVLYLVPTTLGEDAVAGAIPSAVQERVRTLRRFIAEEPKAARSFLKAVSHPGPLAELAIEALDADSSDAMIAALLEPSLGGVDAGVLSKAGAPAVADPGAKLVRRAHELGIRVVPLVGPSAILLALMASGLEGQRFAFHGYLPIDERELRVRLRALEAASRREQRTEVFIETPYRNDRLLRTIVETCAPATLLSIAVDLTLSGETIATRTVAEWRSASRSIGKRPAVFLLLAVEQGGGTPRRPSGTP